LKLSWLVNLILGILKGLIEAAKPLVMRSKPKGPLEDRLKKKIEEEWGRGDDDEKTT